jgi:hypothetical protein
MHILSKEAKNSELNRPESDISTSEMIPRKLLEEAIKFSFLQKRPDSNKMEM